MEDAGAKKIENVAGTLGRPSSEGGYMQLNEIFSPVGEPKPDAPQHARAAPDAHHNRATVSHPPRAEGPQVQGRKGGPRHEPALHLPVPQ